MAEKQNLKTIISKNFPNTHNISKERVLLDTILGDRESSDQFVGLQVENDDRWWFILTR